MRAQHVDEVWRSIDRDYLARIARSGPEPIFAAISGAHLYGFASRDSDVDLRGAYVLPARLVLGLASPRETITREDRRIV
ncbi:MAG TPA: nucleotidyltransferase domain-containing protein, partial [Planctomycetota bacterium]|nr:nucleotidyltransferase domain-containing protein [Planctomycetota bacterium]